QRVFGGRAAPVTAQAGQVGTPPGVAGAEKSLARRAMEHYARSQEFLRQGNLAGFGEELKKLEALLKEMERGR
ncbi:MAG: hypothetical protein HYV00_14200, partial [Deltaproteobacteria bacterium]|nr:hypothetical protein [Deltaproteobacteria bacterium]